MQIYLICFIWESYFNGWKRILSNFGFPKFVLCYYFNISVSVKSFVTIVLKSNKSILSIQQFPLNWFTSHKHFPVNLLKNHLIALLTCSDGNEVLLQRGRDQLVVLGHAPSVTLVRRRRRSSKELFLRARGRPLVVRVAPALSRQRFPVLGGDVGPLGRPGLESRRLRQHLSEHKSPLSLCECAWMFFFLPFLFYLCFCFSDYNYFTLKTATWYWIGNLTISY